MSDKIRQALFSSLASLGIQPVRVLDLYAGTGSIGIEALSRGAEHADFVDHQRAACDVIRANLEHTKLADLADVHCMPITQFLQRSVEPYDFVILDPPYADPGIGQMLKRLSASPLVQSDGVVVLGHWPRLELSSTIGRLALVKRRCHGDSCFSIFEAVDSKIGADSAEAAPQ